MSQIPSDIASSAAQAGFLAREVGREREAGRAGPSNAAQRQAQAVNEAGEAVDTADLGTQVFTDAEGSGSQGRAEEQETQERATGEDQPDVEDGEQPRRLDLQA